MTVLRDAVAKLLVRLDTIDNEDGHCACCGGDQFWEHRTGCVKETVRALTVCTCNREGGACPVHGGVPAPEVEREEPGECPVCDRGHFVSRCRGCGYEAPTPAPPTSVPAVPAPGSPEAA